MKKRVLALLLVLFVLAGCSGEPVQPTQTAPTEQTTEPVEYSLPKKDGCNQLTLYWDGTADLSKADVWVWWDGKEGSGHLLYPCAYGAKAVINVPEGIEQVGFIVRYDCSDPGGSSWGTATKDYEQDRFALMNGDTVIYLKTGEAGQYQSNDGGVTLDSIRKFNLAAMTGFRTIRYSITPAVRITDLSQVRVLADGKEIPVESLSSLNNQVNNGVVTLTEDLDLTKTYQLALEGFEPQTVVPTTIFDTPAFIENYTYDGDDLGAVIKGSSTVFKVWAPTASRVVLNLFEKGDDCRSFAQIEMTRGDRGVWSHTQENCGHGTYYTYTVTTAVGTQETADPYARAAGLNGDRSMVVDLALTDPERWEETPITLEKYADAVIWEVHVRDFSNKIEASAYKGKYLAFTERGLTNEAGVPVGVDYLVELGVTHVHLLPVYDYATVDEANPSFNWGYDPKNYNVPEGSYSTDPYNGQVRINEYKQMVQALHDAGIGVVMDVVYNHTYDANSAFNKLVPYYYYRYNADGTNSSASGCGNDTASERYMFRQFMVQSLSYWTKEYNLDGFRFDLMGLHDLETMNQVEQAVHAINPSALIYGEGWTMGSTIDGGAQANQTNISRISGVSVFNDAIRDGLKGSVFDALSQGYISGQAQANAGKIRFGISGGKGMVAGWQVEDDRVINYMSAHDNRTLWDKLALSNADASVQERLAMNRLGAAIIMVSRGTPFMQAGEEMLRTKGGDENSYNSGDAVNNIDWEALTPDSDAYAMMTYYKGLIALRKQYGIFRGGEEVSFKELSNGAMIVYYGQEAMVIMNPGSTALSCELTGTWKLIANGQTAGTEPLATHIGTVTVDPMTVHIYVQ